MKHKCFFGIFTLLVILRGPGINFATQAGEKAQSFIPDQKLLASDVETGAEFGYSIVLSADAQVLVIGARLQTVNSNNNQGQVYVFRRSGNTWTEVQQLAASDGAANDEFGSTIAIADAPDYTILVGAPYDESSSYTSLGSAYVYTFNGSTWSGEMKLTAIDSAESSSDQRGTSVAISGDGRMAFVGAPNVSGSSGSRPGAVYVFTRSGNTWSQIQKITGPTVAAAGIGRSMSLTGDDQTLFVQGVYSPSGPLITYGVVRVYQKVADVWTEINTLIPSDSVEFDDFGDAIAVTADAATVLIGAPGHEGGRVFGYAKSGSQWVEQVVLSRPSGFGYSFFGAAIVLDSTGTQAAIGAWLNGSGGIYRFKRADSTWQFVQTLITPDDRQEHLGFSIAMSGDTSMIMGGARSAHPNTGTYDPVGAVYVYRPGHWVFLPVIIK